MVGLLIVTHGNFGKELILSSQLIIGENKNLTGLGLHHGESTEDLKLQVMESIVELNQKTKGGVLVLVDMFGGSPSNVVAEAIYRLKETISVQCVTGVNLPMLLEVVSQRDYHTLEQLKEICLTAGTASISSLRERIEM